MAYVNPVDDEWGADSRSISVLVCGIGNFHILRRTYVWGTLLTTG